MNSKRFNSKHVILKKWSYDVKQMSRDPKKITPRACSITATNEMDLQVKVHHNQRVEKLFFSTLSLHPPIKESLVCELKLRIPKLNRMTTPMILEYLDDEGDYCVLGDDEQSFQEMLNCAKVTGSADFICYRLNLKITAAEPSPVEELWRSIPAKIQCCILHSTFRILSYICCLTSEFTLSSFNFPRATFKFWPCTFTFS